LEEGEEEEERRRKKKRIGSLSLFLCIVHNQDEGRGIWSGIRGSCCGSHYRMERHC
jgi:hypothetical protein